MIRLEVQNENQAHLLALGLAHAINTQAQHLTECPDNDVQNQAKTFVWLRENAHKLEKEYGDFVNG